MTAPSRGESGVVAIDGPSASGKSTVARRVAAAIGSLYVDSGALYRGVAWQALRRGLSPSDSDSVGAMLETLDVKFHVQDGAVVFSIADVSPGPALRTREVNDAVSPVAAMPAVRERVVSWLREMRGLGPLVVEGRDIGTVVFPDALRKFYLDADPAVRAQRRHAESAGVSLEDVDDNLKRRDQIDSGRKVAPLRVADGAVRIDATRLGVEEVVTTVLEGI